MSGPLPQPLAFALVSLIWGLTWLPVKVATVAVPPVLLAALRFLLAGLCFIAWARLRGLPLGARRPGRLALAVLLLTVGCYGPLFWGLARAPTGLSAVVNLALMPVFTMLVGTAAGEERIDAPRLVALGLGLAGLALLFLPRLRDPSADPGALVGLAGVVAGTLSYAVGGVVARPLLRAMDPVAFSAWTGLGGLGLLAASLALEPVGAREIAALLAPEVAGALLFLVVAGSLVALKLYLDLLRDWGPFRAALYAFVSPVVAVAVGVAFLGESLAPAEVAGGLVLLAATGFALAPRRAAREGS